MKWFSTKGQISKLTNIELGRISILSLVLFVTLFLFTSDSRFLNKDLILATLWLLFGIFIIHGFYIWNLEKIDQIWQLTAGIFIVDTVFISSLVYYTGISQSVFIVMLLLEIIFCGFVFQRKGALFLSLLTSIFYSFLTIARPTDNMQGLYYSVLLNNFAFFSIAFLSGYLSEILDLMGIRIKEQQLDIKKLEDYNRLIVENISSGLLVLDFDKRVTFINPSFYELVPFIKESLGKKIDQIFPNLFKNVSEKNQNLQRFDYTYKVSDDETRIYGFTASKLKSNENEFVLIFQDLTHIRRLEDAMKRSEKLAAVGQLAAGIAHEIRNPLASISGSLQLLKATFNGQDKDNDKLMNICLKEIDRLNNLISEFLNYVRPEVRGEEEIDIQKILQEVIDMVQVNDKLIKNVKLNLNFNSKSVTLGKKDKLKQVFLNLIINSYQAMETTPNPELKIETSDTGKIIQVKIQDNGLGMTENTFNRLFEPFHTTKPKGTGLGLATVHKILESHDARIFVHSRLGEGTEFTIELKKLKKSNPSDAALENDQKRGSA